MVMTTSFLGLKSAVNNWAALDGNHPIEIKRAGAFGGKNVHWSFYVVAAAGIVAVIATIAAAIFVNSSVWIPAGLTSGCFALACFSIYNLSEDAEAAVYMQEAANRIQNIIKQLSELQRMKGALRELLVQYDAENEDPVLPPL